jgi:hypothetical protein
VPHRRNRPSLEKKVTELEALRAFWNYYWNEVGVFDGIDVYDGKYSLITNEDLVKLDDLAEEVENILHGDKQATNTRQTVPRNAQRPSVPGS